MKKRRRMHKNFLFFLYYLLKSLLKNLVIKNENSNINIIGTKNNKLLRHVDVKPGDAVIFTEALAHGSMINKTNKVRRVLSYCYSVGYMPDWTKFRLEYSKEYLKKAPKKIKKLIKLYKD